MPPIFRRFALLAAALSAPAHAQGFEDVAALEARLVAALGAGIGEPGGPSRPLDRRLRLAPCPEGTIVDPPQLGAAAIRCETLGWRIRVPLQRSATLQAASAQAERAAPLVRRGDQVELVAMTRSFTVRSSGIAEQDGAVGERVRVRTERGAQPVTGEVMADGRVRLPGFN